MKKVLYLSVVVFLNSCWAAKEGCEYGYHKETKYRTSGFEVIIYDEWVECVHDTIYIEKRN